MIIYKTINKINGKIYIGKYCGNNKKYLGSGIILKKAIKKYGKENFSKETLEDSIDDHDYLCEREIYWIEFYDSTNPDVGYNLTSGGKGTFGIHHSNESRKKMSEAQRGEKNHNYGKRGKNSPLFGRHHSKEACKKMSESRKGSKNPFFGKHHSPETLEKIGKARKGKTHSPEIIKKMSGENNPMYGKKGKNNPNYGRKNSPETIKKMSMSKTTSKEIVLKVLELLNRGISVKDIVKKLSISRSTVYKTKNGYYNNIYNL